MTEKKYTLCPDALFYERDTFLVLTSPRARAHVLFSADEITHLLLALQNNDDNLWNKITARDQTSFGHAHGLMVDPTGNASVPGEELAGLPLRDRLVTLRLITESDDTFLNFLGPKTSVLDTDHRGDFHQNISSYQIKTLRLKDNWRWWHDQKFEPDGLSLKAGYYKWIQGHFFDTYFSRLNLNGKRVLDFACGNGFYANRFFGFGAHVTGVDTSKDLMAMAWKNFPKGPEFHCPDNTKACEEFLSALPANHFDAIYLSDALLFFFHAMSSKGGGDLANLLKSFHRLLKSDGRFYLMEPNATFWLPLRVGRDTAQTALVSEYRIPYYTVAPTPDRVIQALCKAGFVVENFIHPEIDEAAREIDPRLYAYAKSFPLWDFYVIKKS